MTNYNMNIYEYIQEIRSLKFKEIYKKENEYIFFQDEHSILLHFISEKGMLDKANMYYNWSPNNTNYINEFTLDGQFTDDMYDKDLEKPINIDDYITYKKKSRNEFNSHEEWINYTAFKHLTDIEKVEKENSFRYVWVGSDNGCFDIKEKIKTLKNNGVFITKWKETPFLWFLTNKESLYNYEDYKSINSKKINLFPDYIKEIIKWNE